LALLPRSLTHLDLGDRFNKPITPGSLPETLVNLTFGNAFNQALPVGVLPASLVDLSFGNIFNQQLTKGVLPSSLTSLNLGRDYKQSVGHTLLPGTLQTLSVIWRTQIKYIISPTTSSSESADLELLEIRVPFVWTDLVAKSKARSIKLLRIKLFLKRNSTGEAEVVGPIIVSLPNVHSFNIDFVYPHNKRGSYPNMKEFQVQARRINERLVICNMIFND
ncbi:hypothetical protein SAMD00019534_114970, partial [Acytostelium subglobosum LB1]|uniref:hypothetical protein n=1 Tax=Acytostelium subglobosum LB1 TaxID=1410327 RepID=UPI000644BB29